MVTLFSVLTWGGSIVVLLPAALVLVFLTRRENRRNNGILLLGGVLGASILANVIKQLFARPRPDVEEMLISAPSGFSFPSAHATQAFAFAAACMIIFGKNAAFGRKVGLLFFLGAGAVVVAFSRVYLRVHFISDVIAGSILGISWILILAFLLQVVEQRNRRK